MTGSHEEDDLAAHEERDDMMEALLDEAVDAFRDGTRGGSMRRREVLDDILQSSRSRQRMWDRAAAALVVFGVLVVAPTVWAHFTGRLPAVLDALGVTERADVSVPSPTSEHRVSAHRMSEHRARAEVREPTEVPEPADARTADPEPTATAEPTAAPTATTEPRSDVPQTADSDPTTQTPRASEEVSVRTVSRPPRRAPRERTRAHPPAPRERELFGAAHTEHWQGASPGRALDAWDAYLAEYPRGHFVPEARYNRALTLVRLGRREDARVALIPFAEGAFGATRQSDAQALLDAL